jgi:hypothetical protein
LHGTALSGLLRTSDDLAIITAKSNGPQAKNFLVRLILTRGREIERFLVNILV